MASDPASSALATPRLEPAEGLAAWLVLLPALVLAWPLPNPIAGDFATTELSGTGVGLLAALPAAGWLAWRRPQVPRALFALALVLLGLVLLPGGTDTAERDRALLGLVTGLVLALAASAQGPLGRALLVRGAALVSVLLTGRALVEGPLLGGAGGLGGVLGNTGELSAAALPGAACGLLLWARAEGRSRWLGLAALVLFLAHAITAPALTSLVALAGAALVALVAGRKLNGPRGARVKLALTLVAALAGGGLRLAPAGDAPAPATSETLASADAPTTTGGLEVRRRVLGATLALVRDHALVGVGAGQFAAAFPPYRDPAEIELSNWQRRVENVTEVEQPHDDWLVLFAEGGLGVGALWCAWLLAVALAAWRALGRSCATPSGLGAASVAVLASALATAPLTYDAPAAVLAFALFGALFARADDAPAPARFGRLAGPALAVLLVLHAPRAWSFWQLGLHLVETTRTQSVTAQELAVDAGLAQVPDSVVALSLKARLAQLYHKDLAASLELWERVLALRPHRFEALVNSGQLRAQLGDLDGAQARLDEAFALDAGDPVLLRNRVVCAADRGRVADALRELDRLEAAGRLDRVWLRDLGCSLLLRGMDREGLPLLARADERFAHLTGQAAYELEAELRRGGSAMAADAFRALSHVIWGREQADAGEWDDARRSYRQNLRYTRERVPPLGPTRVRMEMAAVLWRSRMPEDAKAELEGLTPSAADWSALPAWAGEALFEMGFGVEREPEK